MHMVEHGPKSEFMHQPGEFFLVKENILRAGQVIGSRQTIHVLGSVSRGENPAGSECEDYTAFCKRESQSWSMSSQGIEWARFGKLGELLGLTNHQCCECFDKLQIGKPGEKTKEEDGIPIWLKTFRILCDEMEKSGETEKAFLDRGEVIWCPKVECSRCHSVGTFLGDDLEYGAFYEVAFARYCPSCQNIFEDWEGVNFALYVSERFLPIMKKKLIENPDSLESCPPDGSCPACDSVTHTFHRDLGAIDFYDNYWRVCINPGCNWPGEHREIYEQGPY